MTVTKALFCVLFTSFAVHYGWRMRGTVIGGEKGAMLPGLFAGLSLAVFSGDALSRFFWIPAAAGLIGMTYGGIEPYGDSIALIEDKHEIEPDPVKGLCGLMLKGALWFSICGGFIGMAFSSMGGAYPLKYILAFLPSVIALQSVGYGVFNQPYDKEKGIFPKIYLSYESRDEWGSNIGVLLAIVIFALLRKDFIALIMAGCGFVSGAVGWFIAMKLYHYTEHPLRSGRFLFGVFRSKNLVSGWPNMEYCLGTFGGAGLAIGFVLSHSRVEAINEAVQQNGVSSQLPLSDTLAVAVMTVLFLLLFAVNVFEYVCDKKGKHYDSFVMDCIERPLFNTIPFVFVLACSLPAAKLMTGFMLICALCIKNWFDRFKPGKQRNIFVAVSGILLLAVYFLTVFTDFPDVYLVYVLGGIPYIAAEIIWTLASRRMSAKKALFSLNGFSFGMYLMTAQSIIVVILGIAAVRFAA